MSATSSGERNYSDKDDPRYASRTVRLVHALDRATLKAVRDEIKSRRPGGRNVTVFAAASYPRNPAYGDDASLLGYLLGERGHNIVWGGTDGGLMHEISYSARAAGALLIGVNYFGGDGLGRHNADYMFHSPTLALRKAGLTALGDVAIALPGGLGSFDELASYMEHKKAGLQTPPLIMMNTDGFYDGLRQQMDSMFAEGFSRIPADQLVRFADTPAEAVELASTLQAPPLPKVAKK